MFGNIHPGLDSEAYKDVLGMCVSWFTFEATLFATADKEDKMMSAYYNIVSADPCDIRKLSEIMIITDEVRSVVRLKAVYYNVHARLGDAAVKSWIKSVTRMIVAEGVYSRADVNAFFRKHPYSILIPMLTTIFMNNRGVL